MKPLIAYYSRRGFNLVDGKLTWLTVGNTEMAASILRKLTGGDCFKIEPEKDYPEDYCRCIDLARQDLLKGARPKLKHYPESIAEYEVIYLGYPNYWGTMPVAVFSFLEHFNFCGKWIRPFCTYENGGMGHSERDLKRVCKGAEIRTGFAVRGALAAYETELLEEWVMEETMSNKPKRNRGRRSWL